MSGNAQKIEQLVQAEVHKQLQSMLYCHREGCGHIMLEHTPPGVYISTLWSYCNHPNCNCYRFDNA